MPRRYFWDYKVSTLDYSHYHQHKTDHLQVIYVCHTCKLWEWETSVVKITYPPGGVKEKNTLLGTILGKKRMLASFIDVNWKVGIFSKIIFLWIYQPECEKYSQNSTTKGLSQYTKAKSNKKYRTEMINIKET